MKLALEAKPNESRADIYMATRGQYLGFIPTLDHPEMVGVNPEVAHERMSGLNFMHAVAQAWEASKLFYIDLNDQMPGRFDQDLRYGSPSFQAMETVLPRWVVTRKRVHPSCWPMPLIRTRSSQSACPTSASIN
jgi:hypothetical protein